MPARPTVIAAGGGAVVTPSTRQRLQAPSTFCVWLTAEPAFLASRAAGKAHRPLLDDDPVGTLTRLAAERQPWFEEVADAVVSVQGALSSAPKPQAKARLADLVAEMVRLRDRQRSLDHVVLVGPMGAGKSTVGTLVAKRLRRPYIDSDDEVERRTDRTARRSRTATVCPRSTVSSSPCSGMRSRREEPSVIGSAASVVDESLGRLALMTCRHVAWLHADAEHLAHRSASGGSEHRPTVDPSVIERREPLYRSVATTVIDVDDLEPDVVADKVLQ